MKALRRHGDPAKASALLDQYLRDYPNGILFEEALALAIESKVALEDKGAADLAAQYLERYPNGQFREMAKSARHVASD